MTREGLDTTSFVIESNAIEGIWQSDLDKEVAATDKFLALDEMTIPALVELVADYQPNAMLRIKNGLDVKIGNYFPPPGGQRIIILLEEIITNINNKKISPYEAHRQYESLHPFSDGNGRSGRALWLWHKTFSGEIVRLPFLHSWYYASLSHGR